MTKIILSDREIEKCCISIRESCGVVATPEQMEKLLDGEIRLQESIQVFGIFDNDEADDLAEILALSLGFDHLPRENDTDEYILEFIEDFPAMAIRMGYGLVNDIKAAM